VGLLEYEVGRVAAFDIQLPVNLIDLLLLFIFFQYSVEVLSAHDCSLVHDILLLGLLNVPHRRDDFRHSLTLGCVPLLSSVTVGCLLEDLLPVRG